MTCKFTGAALLGASRVVASAAQAGDLPRSMVWSSSDVGSSGYVEASAIAETAAIVQAVGTALVAIWMLSSGLERYAYFADVLDRKIAALIFVGGLALIVPEWRSDLAGLTLLALGYALRLVFPPVPQPTENV
ncbi:MAG: hypothetical protein EA407_11105 [Rhodobacteraceae bacterium]|nr:MAG: hypothetical protein EA407_11105 [Paracoccaceae bacterium]